MKMNWLRGSLALLAVAAATGLAVTASGQSRGEPAYTPPPPAPGYVVFASCPDTMPSDAPTAAPGEWNRLYYGGDFQRANYFPDTRSFNCYYGLPGSDVVRAQQSKNAPLGKECFLGTDKRTVYCAK
jgi:hypothetical protein